MTDSKQNAYYFFVLQNTAEDVGIWCWVCTHMWTCVLSVQCETEVYEVQLQAAKDRPVTYVLRECDTGEPQVGHPFCGDRTSCRDFGD